MAANEEGSRIGASAIKILHHANPATNNICASRPSASKLLLIASLLVGFFLYGHWGSDISQHRIVGRVAAPISLIELAEEYKWEGTVTKWLNGHGEVNGITPQITDEQLKKVVEQFSQSDITNIPKDLAQKPKHIEDLMVALKDQPGQAKLSLAQRKAVWEKIKADKPKYNAFTPITDHIEQQSQKESFIKLDADGSITMPEGLDSCSGVLVLTEGSKDDRRGLRSEAWMNLLIEDFPQECRVLIHMSTYWKTRNKQIDEAMAALGAEEEGSDEWILAKEEVVRQIELEQEGKESFAKHSKEFATDAIVKTTDKNDFGTKSTFLKFMKKLRAHSVVVSTTQRYCSSLFALDVFLSFAILFLLN